MDVGLQDALSYPEKVQIIMIFGSDCRVQDQAHQCLHFTRQSKNTIENRCINIRIVVYTLIYYF